jgi:hypothetical protein
LARLKLFVPYASTSSISILFPRIRAALLSVLRVTEVWSGSNNRWRSLFYGESTAARLVTIALATLVLVMCLDLVSCCNCQAITLSIAIPLASISKFSSSKKSSKEEPIWGLLFVIFDKNRQAIFFRPLTTSYQKWYVLAKLHQRETDL